MRILFLGNANNPLILNLATELKRADATLIIDIIAVNESAGESAINTFNKIWITGTPQGFWNRKGLKTFWMLRRFRGVLKSVDVKYDFLHMFFLHVGFSGSVDILQRLAKKRIISVFGSELYRSPEVVIRKLRSLVAISDHVTAANPDTLRDFRKRFGYPEGKTSICRFGLQPLRSIDAMKDVSKESHKAAIGIAPETFLITCGYNASAGQQHEAMINSISAVKECLPDPYLLLFPVAMGGTATYISELENKLKAANLNYKFIREFLPDSELAHLRCATDIMIQIQITDQLAGAMQEHLYAGNVVITGAWLPYSVLDERGIVWWKTERVDMLRETFTSVIREYKSNALRTRDNAGVIRDLSSWEQNIPIWYSLYQG
jgi:hypothetical protein